LFCREGVLGMVEVLMLCLGLADKRAASRVSCPQGFLPSSLQPLPRQEAQEERRQGLA